MSFIAKLMGRKQKETKDEGGGDSLASTAATEGNGVGDAGVGAQGMLGGMSVAAAAPKHTAGAPASAAAASSAAAGTSTAASAASSSSAAPAAPAVTPHAIPNVSSVCPALKWSYETCFQHWYNEYLSGQSRDLSGCQRQFEAYRACVIVTAQAGARREGREGEEDGAGAGKEQWYSTHEPEVLLNAGVASDGLLQPEGVAAFATQYPGVGAAAKEKEKAKQAEADAAKNKKK